MNKERDRNAAKALSEYANSFSLDKQEFAKTLTGVHRTIQQTIMDLFMTTIQEFATQEFYDDRNEATVKLAKKIIDENPDFYLPII